MELRTLRYFVTVAQELNITHAAQKLNISQPPLSYQIQKLEEDLGTTLFLRGKRKLQLTDDGVFLLRRAMQILDLSDKTWQEIQARKNEVTGTLYLGLVEGRAPYLVARWIAQFRKKYPLVRYHLWNGSSDDVLLRLNQGLVDLAVIAAPYDTEHLSGFSVGDEPWVAIIPSEHPLAKLPGDQVPLRALVGEPLIVPSRKSRIQAIIQWFGTIDAQPDILCEMSNYLDAVALSEQGVGISIFPLTTQRKNPLVCSKVIVQPARQVEYVLVWNKQSTPLGAAAAFMQEVVCCCDQAKQEEREKPDHPFYKQELSMKEQL